MRDLYILLCFAGLLAVTLAAKLPANFTSSNNISDEDLATISQELAASDINGADGLIKLNLQGQTSSGNSSDMAPAPLFTEVPAEIFSRPTYAALLAMYDNYITEMATSEIETDQEVAEQDAFLDAVLATEVMQKAHQFLVSKGMVDSDIAVFKTYLREIWFGMYPGTKKIVGSSGFEHVFLGELKNGITGLHSWVRFSSEESLGNMNYLGYINSAKLGNNLLIEMPLSWNGTFKKTNSVMVGGSPEYELALYTVCFVARPNASCPVQAHGNSFNIQAYSTNYKGKVYVITTYPSL